MPSNVKSVQKQYVPQKWSKKDHATIHAAAVDAYAKVRKAHYENNPRLSIDDFHISLSKKIIDQIVSLESLVSEPSILPEKHEKTVLNALSRLNSLMKYENHDKRTKADEHDTRLVRSIYALEMLYCLQCDLTVNTSISKNEKDAISNDILRKSKVIRENINKNFPEYLELPQHELSQAEEVVFSQQETEGLRQPIRDDSNLSQATRNIRPQSAIVRKNLLEQHRSDKKLELLSIGVRCFLVGSALLTPIFVLFAVVGLTVSSAIFPLILGGGAVVASLICAVAYFTQGSAEITRNVKCPTVPAYEMVNELTAKLSKPLFSSEISQKEQSFGNTPNPPLIVPKVSYISDKPDDRINQYLGQFSTVYHEDRSARRQFKEQRAIEDEQANCFTKVARYVFGGSTD